MSLPLKRRRTTLDDEVVIHRPKQSKKALCRDEVKFFETFLPSNGTSPTTLSDRQELALAYPLNIISQGTGASQRDGRLVNIKGLQFRHVITNPNPAPEVVRMVVFLDRQSNGSAPSLVNVLQSETPFDAQKGIFETLRFHNMYYETRFEILYDKIFTLAPNQQSVTVAGGVAAGNSQILVDEDIDLTELNLETLFSDQTGTMGALQTNSIHFAAYSQRHPDNAAEPVLSYFTSRVYFTG